MIQLAAVRPPAPEFRCDDPVEYAAQDAQRKATRNACAPLKIENPAGHLRECPLCEIQTPAVYHCCQASVRMRGPLALNTCEAALSRGYSRNRPVSQDTLERRVLDALAGGGWLSSTDIYDKVLPERASMSEDESVIEDRRIGYAIKRLRDKRLVEMRTPHDRKWTREYRIVEKAQ